MPKTESILGSACHGRGLGYYSLESHAALSCLPCNQEMPLLHPKEPPQPSHL